MTKALFLDNAYLREFEATVTAVEGSAVILDQTVFAPKGGGLPSDTGRLCKGSTTAEVAEVLKKDGRHLHVLKDVTAAAGFTAGDLVRGGIDWPRRFALMRMHTAAHSLSAVLNRDHGTLITGNQIDTQRSRMDFSVEQFDRPLMESAIEKTNALIAQNQQVKTYMLPREEAMKIPDIVKLAKGLPPSLTELRIVEIGTIDLQADGGVHVASTGEVGRITLLALENKGKANRRIYFGLEP